MAGLSSFSSLMKTENKTTCLVPNCRNPKHTRGLCASHYQMAMRLVKSGQTTWEKLEEEGKSSSQSKAHPARDWFLK